MFTPQLVREALYASHLDIGVAMGLSTNQCPFSTYEMSIAKPDEYRIQGVLLTLW